MSVRLDYVVARNVVRLRHDRGWAQTDLSREMLRRGMGWTPNRIAQVETMRRAVSPLDMAALAWVFGIAMVDLLDGDDEIELEMDGRTVPLSDVRAAFTGAAVGDPRDDSWSQFGDEYMVRREELAKLGHRFGLEADELGWIAVQVFGRDLFAERDERVGDCSRLSAMSARTKRGHATRGVLGEIRDYIAGKGLDNLRAAFLTAHHAALEDARRQLLGEN